MPLAPYNRRELFLEAIRTRDTSALPDPNNREELFLKDIADQVAAIPAGIPVSVPAELSELLANLPEPHTHTERFYNDIIGALLVTTTVTDTTPFITRETAGGLSVTGTAELKKKIGNTVGVNQLVDTATTTVTIPTGRKYYAVINGIASIGSSDGTAIAVTGGQDIVIDLTLWYGSNDRIPSDLLSHPENWGRYYAGSLAYAAGYLDSADGTVLRSIGRNQLPSGSFPNTITGYANALTEAQRTAILDCLKRLQKITAKVHYIVDADKTGPYVGELDFYAGGSLKKGLMSGSSWDISSFNFDEITNILLYGTSPTQTINFTDATISIYYDGESGYNQTYPYSVLAEVDTGSEVLRGVEGSRDEKLPSGAITRNRAVVDLGTLNWTRDPYNRFVSTEIAMLILKPANNNTLVKLICGAYVAVTSNQVADTDKTIGVSSAGFIQAADSAYSTPAAFKTAMSGVYFEYPLATPTTEQGTDFDPAYAVEAGGSESWDQTTGIPQGHETEYKEFTT